MTDWGDLRVERTVTSSPIWIQVHDTFSGGPPVDRVSVTLERRSGADWVPLAHRHQLSAAGHLAFVGLGRTREPAAAQPFDVRVTLSSPGTIPEAWNGEAALVTTVVPWAAGAPTVPALPEEREPNQRLRTRQWPDLNRLDADGTGATNVHGRRGASAPRTWSPSPGSVSSGIWSRRRPAPHRAEPAATCVHERKPPTPRLSRRSPTHGRRL